MNITAAQVKELREATGVGMMECKQALVENEGLMDKAILWLRERGMSRAAKKAGRTAAEGVVEFAISADGHSAAIVELNCETDFSGKSEGFRGFAKEVVQAALNNKCKSIEELKTAKIHGESIDAALTQLIVKVGENMNLRRVSYFEEKEGSIIGYNHMNGKIGVLVCFKGETGEKTQSVGVDIAMHVAASSPRFLTRQEIPSSEIEQEQTLGRKKIEEQGKKPAEIVEKILAGQMSKFFGEVCLLDQPFVKEPKLSVAQHLSQSGLKAEPTRFVRFQLGEGIEVKEENFAAEVAAVTAAQQKK